MNPLIIIGAGGFGREVHEVIEAINAESPQYDVIGFLDGNPAIHGTLVHDKPVFGGIEALSSLDKPQLVVAVGSPHARARIVAMLEGFDFPLLVHPRAVVSTRARLGKGCVIRAGACIQTGATLGAFCSVSNFSVVGHDSDIGSFCSIAPNVCVVGEGKVGQGSNIGAGSVVVTPASVGEWTVIGANAVVLNDVPANSTVAGVPAKVIKQREPGWHLA